MTVNDELLLPQNEANAFVDQLTRLVAGNHAVSAAEGSMPKFGATLDCRSQYFPVCA